MMLAAEVSAWKVPVDGLRILKTVVGVKAELPSNM